MNFYSSSIITTALTILQRTSEYPAFFPPARGVLGRRARQPGTSGVAAALPPYWYRQINQAIPAVPPKTQSVPKKKTHPKYLLHSSLATRSC